jgi:hypothetical protein
VPGKQRTGRGIILRAVSMKKKKTEVCTKIQKIEFEEVCSVYVLDLDFSYYLDGYVLGKLETSWQFLIG